MGVTLVANRHPSSVKDSSGSFPIFSRAAQGLEEHKEKALIDSLVLVRSQSSLWFVTVWKPLQSRWRDWRNWRN